MTDIFTLDRYGDAPFFIFCDHASNAIPAHLNGLGIPDDILETHIAWDIGAGALASAIGHQLNGAVFKCGFSRLIIDANRAPDAEDLIPPVSDQIPVPGNQMLDTDDRARRLSDFYTPYHDALAAAINEARVHPSLFVLSIHSFTNRLMGGAEERPWKIGLLWRDDELSAHAMMDYLEQETGWAIGDNQPYDARIFNHTMDRHVGPRKLPHLTIEVRQDVIMDEHDIVALARLIAEGVRKIAANGNDARQ